MTRSRPNDLNLIDYQYDPVDQLTGESSSGGATGSAYSNAFTYDAMGNRTRLENVKGANTTVTRSTPNALNQLTALSTAQNGGASQTSGLAYDVGGNLTQTTASDGSKTLYTYDDADRLTRIERKDAAGAFTSKSEFVYDYASRKVVSREFAYLPDAPAGTDPWVQTNEVRRVFDGLDVVQERNAANEASAQYVRDGNIGGILSRASASGKSYFHYDGGGNVTALSDENGALVGRYSYDAFGNTLEVAGARAAENPYRFSTKESIAGMVDFGYRFYLPGMGRWLNRDPIRESGGVNLYGMVGNNPINAVDEYGENGAAVGVAVGIGYGAYRAYQAYRTYRAVESLSKTLQPGLSRLDRPQSQSSPQSRIKAAKQSRRTPKEKKNDVPDWSRSYNRNSGETPKDFATRILKEQGRPGNTGPRTEHSKIQKGCEEGVYREAPPSAG